MGFFWGMQGENILPRTWILAMPNPEEFQLVVYWRFYSCESFSSANFLKILSKKLTVYFIILIDHSEKCLEGVSVNIRDS